MTNRSKVIKGLECCSQNEYVCCEECPYVNKNSKDGCNGQQLTADALALLKEQPKTEYNHKRIIDADKLLEEIKKDCDKNPQLYFIIGFISKYIDDIIDVE